MKISVYTKEYNGIPYLEYINESAPSKGLLFVQHGYTSSKEEGAEWLAMKFVREEFHVVCVDAYKHGARIEEPFLTKPENEKVISLFEIVPQTAKDIITLFEGKFTTYNHFDYIGISMGGMIGFMLVTFTDKVSKVAPVIGAPYHLDCMKELNWFDDRSFLDKFIVDNEDEIKMIDPINNVDKMKYDKMFILYGIHDTVVPGHFNQRFYDEYKHDNLTLKAYDAGHETTDEMQADLIRFMNSEMVE